MTEFKRKYVKQLKNITREQIFQQYPWLKERNVHMVTHNDFDGLLTALIFHHVLGWKLVGLYDLEKLWISKDFKGNLEDIVYVDLDVTKMGCRSIGHHMVADISDHLNLNHLFGVGTKDYYWKFPLSTALFLFWLYEIPFNSPMSKLMLIHSDSVWLSHKNYTDNVENWLNHFGMTELVNLLNNQSVFGRIENGKMAKSQFTDVILEKSLFKFVQTEAEMEKSDWKYRKKKENKSKRGKEFVETYQFSFAVQNGEFNLKTGRDRSLQDFMNGLSKVFGFAEIELPVGLEQHTQLKRINIEFDAKKESFKEIMERELAVPLREIFSHGLVYNGVVNLSYL